MTRPTPAAPPRVGVTHAVRRRFRLGHGRRPDGGGAPLLGRRDKGIYGNAVDYDDMRMAWYIELSPIVMVAGVLIGIDVRPAASGFYGTGVYKTTDGGRGG